MSSQDPKEEFIQRRKRRYSKCREYNKIHFDKFVSIATDGARSMTGKNEGATTILQSRIKNEILTFPCMIHQEAICAQTFLAEIVGVMNLVIKIVRQHLVSITSIVSLKNS